MRRIRRRTERFGPRGERCRAARLLALGVLTLGVGGRGSGCGGEVERDDTRWVAVRDTLGDTVVVRTVAGSIWGRDARLVEEVRIGRLDGPDEYIFGSIVGLAVDAEGAIYVSDRQAPALRKYDPDGTYVGTLGRKGSGPGEYERPDGGLAVLPDGRVLLRDPANGRIDVYDRAGEYVTEWRIRGGMYTSRPLYVDTAGTVFLPVFKFSKDGRWRLARLGPGGEAVDSLPPPEWNFAPATLEATFERDGGRSVSIASVPFSPGVAWTFSPLGYFVGGVSSRYAIDLFRRDAPVLRIEREVPPVSVRPEEKADERRRTTASLRGTDPKWKWNGPPIPDTKPPFKGLWVDLDGRIWVQLSTKGERVPAAEVESTGSQETGSRTEFEDRWREPVAFDVFEPDGRFLGTVRAGSRVRAYPQPVARGDHLWAVEEGELDVPYVVRYRIVHGEMESREGG